MSVSDDSIISALRVSLVPLAGAPYGVVQISSNSENGQFYFTISHLLTVMKTGLYTFPFKLLHSFRIPTLYNVCFVFVLFCVLKFCCAVSLIDYSFSEWRNE